MQFHETSADDLADALIEELAREPGPLKVGTTGASRAAELISGLL
jgi:hypothetical protein